MSTRFGPASSAWYDAMAPVWDSREVAALRSFLDQERQVQEVVPRSDQVFAAFDAVAPGDVRVVILGQDPYPTPGHAHGLAFSYRGEGSLPRSLGNIRREIERDLDVALPDGAGDLTPWANQGVLLLNTVLTTRAGEAGAHRRKGWEAITQAALAVLDARAEPVVFLLWGGDARKRARRIASHHHIFEAGHPSPLSVRYFAGCGHFSAANALLGDNAVDWTALRSSAS